MGLSHERGSETSTTVRQYQPNNCPYDATEFTVPASEVIRRWDTSLSSLDRWGRLPATDPYHLYGLKKGRFWYYREQDLLAHPVYGTLSGRPSL